MKTMYRFLRVPTLTLCLLAIACDSGETTKGKADDKKADAKKAGDDKAGGKAADAKKTDAPPAAPKKYKPGQKPPANMDAAELKVFAADVGDPTGGEFDLAKAFAGDAALADKANGTLTATLTTSMGTFDCALLEDEAPISVANFVGLARGVRPTWDHHERKWVEKKIYDGVIFHRVMENFMVQTGDASTAGGTNNPGYVIQDELDGKHGKAGALSMANQEKPNTGSTQFFVTVRPTPHLDGKHSVFGRCDPKVATEISKVKVNKARNSRPYEQVKLESVTISRKK